MRLQKEILIEEKIKDIFDKKDKSLYPPFPKKNLLIEISNHCNSKCIFCANRKMTRPRKEIEHSFLERILKEAYELGSREVGFYTTGEPLLNKNLEKYISLAQQMGYEYIYITTNGILAKLDKMKRLIDVGLNSVKFSINAINKEEYKLIHGVSAYELVMKNLTDLYNYKKETLKHFNLYVSYVATRYTEHSNKIIEEHFKNKCDKVIIVNARNQSGMLPEINSLLSPKNQQFRVQANRVLPCHYTFDCVIVTVEGYLTACCTDFQNYLAYADLNNVSLKAAWTNECITELRRKQINNCLEGTLCDNCSSNTIKIPKPLCEDLAIPMEREIFEDFSFVKDKINDFKQEKNML